MRRRERDEVSEVARRRLELLQAELAGLRREPDREPDREQQAGDHEEFWTREQPPLVGPAALGVPAPVREPGRHARGVRAGPGYRVPGWLAERVPAALRGRVGLSGQHGVVVLALVGVALVVAGWLAVRSGAHADAVPPPRLVTTGGSATAEASPAVPAGTAASAAATGQVVVDVAGKVRRPGIVTLPAGSRVQDAIRRAGGPRPGVGADVPQPRAAARRRRAGPGRATGGAGRGTQCRGRVTRGWRAGQPQRRRPVRARHAPGRGAGDGAEDPRLAHRSTARSRPSTSCSRWTASGTRHSPTSHRT